MTADPSPPRATWFAWASVVAAGIAFILASVSAPGATLADVRWLSGLGSRFHLAVDRLTHPILLFSTGIAVLILWYATAYLPEHLAERRRPQAEQTRFFGLMLAFMAAMVLLLLAQDLLLLFFALELTALTSFLLIEFDREDPGARRAASVALIVTVGSSLLFVVGALWLGALAGTMDVPELRTRLGAGEVPPLAAAALAIGVLGKSAQVPLHFWLPRAMVAPTPVSAYLHSAALVAAGVFVLLRLRFLLTPGVLDGLWIVGFASILVGGALALVNDELKRILAYSTIAQYGYIVVLISLGGDDGLAGAPFVIVAHGLAKSALFMTAGAVTSSTGAERLSETRGRALRRGLPALAISSAISAAALAGLPLTIGYFKDDVLLAAAVRHGAISTALAAAAVAITVAYTARFWFGVFAGGTSRARVRPIRAGLLLPVVLLSMVVLLGGILAAPLAGGFGRAGELVGGRALSFELAYRLRAETGIALLAWITGFGLFALARPREASLGRLISSVSRHLGPAHLFEGAASLLAAASRKLHQIEIRDLRDRVSAVLLPAALFVALALWAHGALPEHVGTLEAGDLPLAGALVLTGVSAIVTATPLKNIALVILASFAGFSLALTFALFEAPNVALVVVLIETTLTILFLALLWKLRPELIVQAEESERAHRGPWTGLVAGAAAFLLAWFALSARPKDGVASEHVALASEAHARDVVTAILADFRGLDTLGELTILAVTVFGAVAISWGRER